MLNLLSPRTAIKLLANQINSQTGKKEKFTTCDIVMNAEKESLEFIIDGVLYKSDQDELKEIFKTLGSEHVDDGYEIDIMIIKIDYKAENEFVVEFYTSRFEGEKKAKKVIL